MNYQNETTELDSLYTLAKEEQKNSKKKFLVWAGGDAPNQANPKQGICQDVFGLSGKLRISVLKRHLVM